MPNRLINDLKYGARSLARSPIVLVVALVSLGIGVGGNIAIFSLVDAVILRPLPGVAAPAELVSVSDQVISYPAFRDFAEASPGLSGLAAYAPRSLHLDTGDGIRTLEVEAVSGNFFAVLGVQPALGRPLLPGDDLPGASPVALLSHAYWQESLGGDAEVIGTTIRLNGAPVTVVGVAPPRFRGPEVTLAPALWLPLHLWKELAGPPYDELDIGSRNWGWLQMVGRLAPGATLTAAQLDLDRSAERQRVDYPAATPEGFSVRLLPTTSAATASGEGEVRPLTWALMGVMGIVLLLACANLSSLLLARTESRRREMAIRSALGAGVGTLARQLLAENALLAAGGAATGLLAATWGIGLLNRLELPDGASLGALDLQIDLVVFAFALTIATVTLLLFGAFPALRGARTPVGEALGRQGSDRTGDSGWGRGALLATQVALCAILLTLAGLFLQSLRDAYATELGYDPASIGYLSLSFQQSDRAPATLIASTAEIARRMEAVPGVRGVAWTRFAPMSGSRDFGTYQVEGRPVPSEGRRSTALAAVGTGYFRTLGIPIVRGRELQAGDERSEVRGLVISASFAAREWPGEDPLGAVIRLGPASYRIVGVVADARMHALDQAPVPFAYMAIDPDAIGNGITLMVNAERPEGALAAAAQIATTVEPAAAVESAATLARQLSVWLAPQRVIGIVAGLFGGLTLLLAAVGTYGIVAYAVSHRTRELGIRAALGGRPADLVNPVVRRAILAVGAGLLLGLPLSIGGGRLVQSLLLGVAPADPVALGTTALALLSVAAAAAYLPARRAARINPIEALRAE